MTGSIISAVSIFLSSYSSSLSLLLLTYGVLGGVGLGLMYAPAVVTVGQYFKKRLNLATGISVCGSGAGTFLFAPIASHLISNYGWRGCNRVMAAFCLLCSILGLVMAPNVQRQRNSSNNQIREKKLIDVGILKNVPFLLYILSNIPTLMGVYTLFSYLPAIGDSNGLSPEQSSFLISMIGITNTIGRVIFGWLTDMPGVSPLMVNLVATFISTLFPILLSFPHRYSAYLAISATLGLSISPLPTVTSGIITDMLGSSKLNDAFGILTFVRGASALLGPPLAGYLADYHHDFSLAFSMTAAQFGVSFVICCGVWYSFRSRRNFFGYSEI